MGCSICLDAYGDDDDVRPVCLPCGHVFHGTCIAHWLNAGPSSSTSARRGCPKCKAVAHQTQIIRLWPDDVHDLDRLLADRNDPDLRWASSLPHLTADEARQLLDDLVDFQCAAQQYVQGILGVNAVSTRVAGKRMFKLIQDKTNNPVVQQNLQMMLSKFESSLTTFDKQLHRLSIFDASLRKSAAHVEETRAAVRKKRDEVHAYEKTVRTREGALAKGNKELAEARTLLHTQMEGWKAHVAASRVEVEKSKHESQQAAAEAAKARVAASQWVAARESELDEKARQMNAAIAAADARREEAERERDAHRDKEIAMAGQMKAMQEKYGLVKEALQGEKAKRTELAQRYESEKAKLQKELLKAVAAKGSSNDAGPSSSTKSAAAPPTSSSRRASTIAASLSPTAPPPSKRRRLPILENESNDGSFDGSVDASSSSLVFVESSSRRTNRSSSSKAAASGHFDALYDSDDSIDAPMPGLGLSAAMRGRFQKQGGGKGKARDAGGDGGGGAASRKDGGSSNSSRATNPFGRVTSAPAAAAATSSSSSSSISTSAARHLADSLQTAQHQRHDQQMMMKQHHQDIRRHQQAVAKASAAASSSSTATATSFAHPSMSQLLGGKHAAVVTGPRQKVRG